MTLAPADTIGSGLGQKSLELGKDGMRTIPAEILALACAVSLATGGLADEPTYFPRTTVKRWQLTGDVDAPRRLATASRTASRAGVFATDLGSSFEHEGRLYFLFGDTVGRPGARDVIAWTTSDSPDGLRLDFYREPDRLFRPLSVPGISLGPFEVPSYGISVEGRMYVVFTTDHGPERVMGRSVLAVSGDDGRTFRALHDLSTDHFINVAMARASRDEIPGLPFADAVLIWGSGEYRASSPRLAAVPAGALGDPAAIRYLRGVSSTGVPLWGAGERFSADLFDHPVVGELSVAWIEPLERWVMLYNSVDPRGIVMRTAERPWGPWSPATVIFDPWTDMGYSQFLHVSWDFEQLDTFHDPGRQTVWGGEYGPYLIERFTQGDAIRTTIFYTLSTWNPYQVVLMSSDIGFPERLLPGETTTTRTLPGDPGWQVSGSFLRRFRRGGVRHVNTFAAGGDADTGVAYLPFDFGEDDGWISFTVHGGDAEVVLIDRVRELPATIPDVTAFYDELKRGAFGRVLEAVHGPRNNAVDVGVRWHLGRHTGRDLALLLIDKLTAPWGFVAVSEISITRQTTERPPRFLRGDCNGDGAAVGQVSDAIFIFVFSFLGGSRPPCMAACDVDGDGAIIGVTDAIRLLHFNFIGGPPPPPPFPACGPSTRPGDEALGCEKPPAGCE